MHRVRLVLCAGMVLTAICAAAQANQQPDPSKWTMVWSDEFNGPDGSPADSSKWVLETGGDGWGNQELEYYTTRPQNSYQEGGNLVIKALAEKYTGADKVTRGYTSARLKTQGKFSQAYGRFEARIKIPRGQGLWPAFWMLGADIDKVQWPKCGEIDIMENIGKEPYLVHGTIHGPGYSGDKAIGKLYALSGEVKYADDFHIYAVEWAPKEIRFYVDDHLYKLASLPICRRARSGCTTIHSSSVECCCRRGLARKSGRDFSLSANHAGGLRARL